jgi:hypothetical protein
MERILWSTIIISAIYWLSISPENIPAPLVKKGGNPTLRAGWLSLFIRLSDMTLTMVMDAPTISIGKESGDPWKLAPESWMFSSGKKRDFHLRRSTRSPPVPSPTRSHHGLRLQPEVWSASSRNPELLPSVFLQPGLHQ